MPSVSIIVPSLNQGAFIGQTVHSILGQDFGELECVVMDGGSTDDTLDILRSINDPRLTWVSEPDRGQSDAINKGLQRASGQFLSYLNSDDVLLPGAVSSAVAAFDRLPEADLIAGDLLFINDLIIPLESESLQRSFASALVSNRLVLPLKPLCSLIQSCPTL